jgi:hypothetical protein
LADCPLLITNCFNMGGMSACFYNACGPGWQRFLPISGPDYYAPCDAAGTGDGLCLPAETPQLGTVGVCLQGGSVDGGPCLDRRIDGGVDLCGIGSICAALPDGGPSSCNPVCAASQNGSVDGGPFCGSGAVCANVLSAAFDFGQCLQSCNGTVTCSGSAVCEPLSLTQSVCYP